MLLFAGVLSVPLWLDVAVAEAVGPCEGPARPVRGAGLRPQRPAVAGTNRQATIRTTIILASCREFMAATG